MPHKEKTLSKGRFWVYDHFPKMVLVPATGHDAIQCLGCGMISYNENDIRERYCGNCHKFGSLLE